MCKTEKVSFERVKANNIKITYSNGEKRTEILARVVQPGSYKTCDTVKSTVSKEEK